jgi:integrase
VGLYKLCEHKGRARDRCEHVWWARFRRVRVSLDKWSNREIGSKTEADAVLDDLRKAVRAGTFDRRGVEPPREVSPQTFRQFAEVYKERHVLAKGLALAKTIDYRLRPLIEGFGDRPIAEIKTANIEDFIAGLRKPRIVHRRPELRTLTNASINRTIELLRHMLNWAVGREYLDRTPFRRGTETLIRKLREDNQRRRRLTEEEEARLLDIAPPFLRSMIITALDTGMRQGEMLALRFGDIDWKRQLIVLRGVTTKSRKTHPVPIATTRLHAVLKWLQLDGAGQEKPAEALVFSDETGEAVGRFRTAWVTAVLKSHDVKPEWKAYGWTALTPECAEHFRRINLHWHDLRHEYASRLVEKGVPLAQVRDLLGHASITTTERYDNQKLENLQLAAARLESGKNFDPSAHTNASGPKCQVFVKNSTEKPLSGAPNHRAKTGSKSRDDQELEDWLGGRDSNPDNVVQSHVSYRWTTSQYRPLGGEG